MKRWVRLAVAEDRLLLSLLDYMLLMCPEHLRYAGIPGAQGAFTFEDADRLSKMMREFEDLAVEMTSPDFDPKRLPDQERRMKELRRKIEATWRVTDTAWISVMGGIYRRLGIRR